MQSSYTIYSFNDHLSKYNESALNIGENILHFFVLHKCAHNRCMYISRDMLS
jgi:hypothetical protein